MGFMLFASADTILAILVVAYVPVTTPPSTLSTAPLTNEAASEASHT
jgi:hypothetical protein